MTRLAERHVFHTRYQSILALIVGIAMGLGGLAAAGNLVARDWSSEPKFNVLGIVAFVLVLTLPFAAWCLRLARAGAEATNEGVTLKMLRTDRFVPWNEVRRFVYGYSKDFGVGRMCIVELVDGESISVIGISGPNLQLRSGKAVAETQIEELNRLLADAAA